MAELKESQKIYYIPDNFIEEGRIFQGKVQIRHLVDAIVLAACFSVIGILIVTAYPMMELEGKISIFIALCSPPAILGLVGYNGDPISAALKYAVKWKKNNVTMLYNPTPRLLKRDPLRTVLSQTGTLDSIIDVYENRKKEKIKKKATINIVEGEDYYFEDDAYVDDYTKRIRKGKYSPKDEYLISSKSTKKIPVVEIISDEDIRGMDIDSIAENNNSDKWLSNYRFQTDAVELDLDSSNTEEDLY